MRSKLLSILLLALSLAQAKTPESVSFFSDKPRSLAKDFYIHSYLQRENTTPGEAQMLFGMVHTMNLRLFHLFAKKMDNPDFKKISHCIDQDITTLLKEDDTCLNIGITLGKMSSLPKSKLSELSSRLSPYHAALRQLLPIMQDENVTKRSLESSDELLLTLLQGSITAYKKEVFADAIPPKRLQALAHLNKFNTFAINVCQNNALVSFQKALVHVNPTPALSAKSLFFMGLNALKYDEKERAHLFFEESAKRATHSEERDKAIFWRYHIDQEPRFLTQLTHSHDINLYTLYAYELLQKPFPQVHSSTFEGMHPAFDITDPFAWVKLQQKIFSMESETLNTYAKDFTYGNTLAHYSYMKERATHYQEHHYPIPFPEELHTYTTHRKALMLAIARQESRFLPSVVSTSYALGMMQFMPFVANDIAKKEKLEGFELEALFDPRIAYLFANIHLDFLERSLYHPLFVAYAYNGGIGFTKRHLLSQTFKEGMYEPFWSMEMMINQESREYGKKVLANYVVYRYLLGEPVVLSNLFEILLKPSLSDRFRN